MLPYVRFSNDRSSLSRWTQMVHRIPSPHSPESPLADFILLLPTFHSSPDFSVFRHFLLAYFFSRPPLLCMVVSEQHLLTVFLVSLSPSDGFRFSFPGARYYFSVQTSAVPLPCIFCSFPNFLNPVVVGGFFCFSFRGFFRLNRPF